LETATAPHPLIVTASLVKATVPELTVTVLATVAVNVSF
jgi:hypothetical protein